MICRTVLGQTIGYAEDENQKEVRRLRENLP